MTLAILAGSASIPAAYRRSINPPAMTPPTLSGNARCARSARLSHPSCEAKQLGGRSDQPRPTLTPRLNPHSARGTDGAPTSRDFVPRRFSDAGLRVCGRPRHRRRPKTCTSEGIGCFMLPRACLSQQCPPFDQRRLMPARTVLEQITTGRRRRCAATPRPRTVWKVTYRRSVCQARRGGARRLSRRSNQVEKLG